MKKIIALLMALCMLFVLVACSAPCTQHIDEDHNLKCDTCQADVTCTNHNDADESFACDYCGDDMTPEGIKLSGGVVNQIKGAKSAKIELTYSNEVTYNEWYYETEDEQTVEVEYVDTDKQNSTMTIIIAKTDDFVNIAVNMTTIEQDIEDGTTETYEEEMNFYLVDGVAYAYVADGWYTYEETEIIETIEMLSTLLDGIELTDAEIQQIYRVFGESIITGFNVFENKGTVYIDFKPMYDNLVAYLDELDFDTDTIADVLDDALALISPTLTAEALLEEVERVAGLTVNEAAEELDAWLTEEYGTTLQGMFDAIVADERFDTLISNIMNMQFDGSDATEEEINRQTASLLADIKGFKFADFIEEMSVGEITLYDLVFTFIAEVMNVNLEENPYPTIEQTFEQVRQTLALTINEFETGMGMPFFTSLKEMLAKVDINAFNTRLDINFKNIFEIDSIEGALNMEMFIIEESEVEGKNDTLNLKTNYNLKIYDISTESVNITAPEKALPDVFGRTFYSTASYNDTLVLYAHDDGSVNLVLCVTYNGKEVQVYSIVDDLNMFTSNTITFPSEGLQAVHGDSIISHDTTTDLVVVLNTNDNTFTISSCPSFGIQGDIREEEIYKALNEIGFEKDSNNSEKYSIDPELGIYFTHLGQGEALIYFENSKLDSLAITFDIDENGAMQCTIKGFSIMRYYVWRTDFSGTFRGGETDYENLIQYFIGGDITFTLYLTEDGVVTCDDFPVFDEQYIAREYE